MNATTPLRFKIGDAVTFTNDYGVVFKGRKVTGYFKPEANDDGINSRLYSYGYRYFIDSDAPWMPTKESALTPETNANA